MEYGHAKATPSCSVGTWIDGAMFPRYSKSLPQHQKRQRRYMETEIHAPTLV